MIKVIKVIRVIQTLHPAAASGAAGNHRKNTLWRKSLSPSTLVFVQVETTLEKELCLKVFLAVQTITCTEGCP